MNVGSLTWDIARTGGLVAYALLTGSVAIGLLLSLGWRSPRWTRFVTNEVHRFVTLLALVFIVIHGVAIAIDPFIKMSLADVLVPFLTSYRPVYVAFGIIAGYLAVAVYLSERIRGRIGYTWWRRFHGFAFVAFALALVHGIGTGSDTRSIGALGIYGSSLFLVGLLLILRLLPDPPRRARPVVAGMTILGVAAVVGFTVIGPLQPGWNAKAGGAASTATVAPSDGAATSAAGNASTPAATPAPAGLGVTVSSPLPFDGTLSRRGRAVQVQGQTTDGSGAFLFQLVGDDDDARTSGQVVLNTGTGQVCQGTVASVGDTTIDATCATADGTRWSLRLAVTRASQGQISGTVEVSPDGGSAPGSGGASG